MNANRWWMMAAAVAGCMAWGGSARAQMSMYNPAPASDLSGYAGREMRSVYHQGIGNDYSTGQLIKNNYNQTRATVPYVGQSVGTTGSAMFNLGTPTRTQSKPFAAHRSSPTVSPWMNMFREDLSGEGDLNYQTLVRPELQQQQVNRQLERQNMELGQRVQTMSAQNAYNPQGSDQIYPTGHPTVFMNYGHYFPTPQQRKH